MSRVEPAGLNAALSDELRVMFRPATTYRSLAPTLAEPLSWAGALRRPLQLLVVLGGFVSITAAGRITVPDVLSTLVAWMFAPIVQVFALVVALKASRLFPKHSLARIVDLYFAGQGPWLLFLTLFAGGCLVLPDPGPTFSLLLRTGILPGYLLVTLLWGGVTTWAFFRHALGFPSLRTGVATAVFYSVFSASIMGWYLAVHELQPLVSPP